MISLASKIAFIIRNFRISLNDENGFASKKMTDKRDANDKFNLKL